MKQIFLIDKLPFYLSILQIIFFWFFIGVGELIGQDIAQYKEKFPLKTYNEYVAIEKEALEESNFLRKAELYEYIGKKIIE